MFRSFVIFATVALLSQAVPRAPAAPPIECVATGLTAGKLTDRSKLHGKLEDGTPADRLGGWGSAIAYTGHNDLYVALPDRGPNASSYKPSIDNTTSYAARIESLRILVNVRTHAISVTPVETLLLSSEDGSTLRGLSTDFIAGQPSDFPGNRRFDPEGLRVSGDCQHYYVSDEYGPSVFEFDARSGRRTRAFSLPSRFAVSHPAATAVAELAGNAVGRQANHGLEGLAITPDGRRLVAILQSPLLQDVQADAAGQRVGVNVRMLAIDVETGQTRQFVYQLADGKQHGVSEIVAVNSHEFLVLERDAKAADKAKCKSLFLIDLDGASDVGDIDTLSPSEGFRPVAKRMFLDLLDSKYGLAGPTFPAKIEGLTFGPDLADGRHLLLISSDNDFQASVPSRLFAFAIDRSALPDYEPQRFVASGRARGSGHERSGLRGADSRLP